MGFSHTLQLPSEYRNQSHPAVGSAFSFWYSHSRARCRPITELHTLQSDCKMSTVTRGRCSDVAWTDSGLGCIVCQIVCNSVLCSKHRLLYDYVYYNLVKVMPTQDTQCACIRLSLLRPGHTSRHWRPTMSAASVGSCISASAAAVRACDNKHVDPCWQTCAFRIDG